VEAAGIEPASGDAGPPRLYRLSRCFATALGASTGKLPEGVPPLNVGLSPGGRGEQAPAPWFGALRRPGASHLRTGCR